MLVVDTQITWQEKLGRLERIFRDQEIRILITIRDPLPGAFSLYVELFEKLNRDFSSFDEYWRGCNQAKIFRYQSFLEFVINTFGRDVVCVLSFEQFVRSSDIFIEQLTRSAGMPLAANVLPKTNSKKHTDSGVWTAQQSLRRVIMERFARGPKFSANGAVRFLAKKLIRGFLDFDVKSSAKFIVRPDFGPYRGEIRQDLEWVSKEFGIDYRG